MYQINYILIPHTRVPFCVHTTLVYGTMKIINIHIQIGCQVVLVLQVADLEYIPMPLTLTSQSESQAFLISPCLSTVLAFYSLLFHLYTVKYLY